MKMRSWNQFMTDKETADLAYWERNVLALHLADGWYNDDVYWKDGKISKIQDATLDGFPMERPDCELKARYPDERRVLSCFGGKASFHVPNDFDVGNLPMIERNWDGHSTEEKWARILKERGVG